MSSPAGVPQINRLKFIEALEAAVAASREEASHLGVLLIDVTNLARINHSHGYSTGDQILIATCDELLKLSKLEDTVYRVGSHCFGFILPDLGNPGLIALAINRVTAVLQTAPLGGSNRLQVDINVGVAISQEGRRDFMETLAMAESSLAHVKLGGDHRIEELLSSEEDSLADYRLEQVLGDAIRENEFELYYQPKVSLHSGMVHSAEALLRWSTPEGEWVSPELIVSMAEGMGRSYELTKWVIHQAMRQMKKWQSHLDLGLALNVQAELVSNPDLASLLRDASVIWGVDPERITVEITENAIIEDKEAGFNNLSLIKDNGMKLSIDDFGTGYSSLSYFKHIPATELKIDKSFVESLLTDAQDLELVKIMISIARQFGMSVVAEGVENKGTLQLLRDLGCDLVQGYYVAPPMTAEDFEAWIASRESSETME